jgi:3'-5' exonuclease
MGNVVVWDIETVPDVKAFGAANRLDGKSDDEIRAAIGDKFRKHIYHSIICIGALVAHREDSSWAVDAIGAPHVGERPEKMLISSFVDRIAKLTPQLVTFNGSSFDLPVLRYRAMVHGVAAPGLLLRPYFNRYTEDAIDLCDVLSSFSYQGRTTLDELSRVLGLPGKPEAISGGEVEKYYRDGHIQEIAAYCESDVINTYRIWLRFERFCGRLSEAEFQRSEAHLLDFITARANTISYQRLQNNQAKATNGSPEATDGKRLAEAVERALASGRRDVLTPDALQALMAAICKAYAAQVEAGEPHLPLPNRGSISATEVMVTASGLLKAANLAVFELGMWQSWTGRA